MITINYTLVNIILFLIFIFCIYFIINKPIVKSIEKFNNIQLNKKQIFNKDFEDNFKINFINQMENKNYNLSHNEYKNKILAHHDYNIGIIRKNYNEYQTKINSLSNVSDLEQKNKLINSYLEELIKKNNLI